MADVKNLIETLHPLERKVFPLLKDLSDFNQIVSESGLQEVEVMRALQWLNNKSLIELSESSTNMVSLDKNGLIYVKKGLPELRFLNSLTKSPLPVDTILNKSGIDKSELNICIGMLKKKAAINILQEKTLDISITPQGEKLLEKPTFEEEFLKSLSSPRDISKLSPEEKYAFDILKSRKEIIKIDCAKQKTVVLTDLGKKLVKLNISAEDVIDALTPKILDLGSWKNKKFRRYDVTAKVPKVYGAKRHFVNQALDYIKRIWLDLGFKEMTGTMIQTSFWDLDSLFVPQDHPARQMQDTFFIKDPKQGKLPTELAKTIKKIHETGADTGSKGWQAPWSEEIAKENLLRTHTTVLSAHTLSKLKPEDLPVKFFSVGKVFRNEALDYKHLFEFYQVEGIVVDPNANLKNLKGYLREFFTKMGYLDVRLRPSHYPYTEPSMDVEVLHPVRKEWIELGGAGIFRPEVTKALLGFECPVLAWGLGMARIISEYWKITDIRDMDKNDLKQIKESRYWMR